MDSVGQLEPSVLLFFVDDDDGPAPGDAEAIEKAVVEMASAREWVVEPPEFVDHLDEGDDGVQGSYSDRTLGGALALYAPRTAEGRELPRELDRRLLDDARALVARVVELAQELNLDFAFELDQDSVGWIEGGEADDALTEGLLGEWERAIEEGAPSD